jgi:hypothetical protein
MFGYGKEKKLLLRIKIKIKIIVVANVGDEKREEQLLMRSTEKKTTLIWDE